MKLTVQNFYLIFKNPHNFDFFITFNFYKSYHIFGNIYLGYVKCFKKLDFSKLSLFWCNLEVKDQV